jgi:hypothetical protein
MRYQASFSDPWSAPLNRPPPYNGVQLASFERFLQCCAKGGALPFFVRQAPRPEPATPDWPGPRLLRSADFCNSRIASAELARAGQASGVFWTEPPGLLPRSVSERKASFYGFTNRAAVVALRQEVTISNFSKRALFWTPRILSIAFIAFLSLLPRTFSLNILGFGRQRWRWPYI